MHSYTLQDWITITGTANAGTVTQPDDGWLNLESYKDLQFWIDVADIETSGGTITLVFQHAPTRDEVLFYPSINSTVISNAGLYVRSSMFDYACAQSGGGGLPISKWLRWQITGIASASRSITFRILVSAGACGTGIVPDRLLSRLAD